MKRIYLVALASLGASSAFAAPLFPEIIGHDINFGAWNGPGPAEWSTNGLAADTLTYTLSEAHHEATAYWPAWPSPPVLPLYGAGGIFGADFGLQVKFDAQDAPYVGPGGVIDVSLTGTGASPGADLVIFGSVGAPGPVALLWAVDLDAVSLYGYDGGMSYVLEGVGTIVGGLIAQQNNLIGRPGGMRGQVDFLGAPADWIPPLYDPLLDPRQEHYRMDYSGETGVVPEPATLAALGLGAVALIRRRRR